ncbi:MAG: hypothetical protein PHR30_16650 [Gallionellaceae bacterium]|nr:hypothetical protein [Gallionellaceae bacterium]
MEHICADCDWWGSDNTRGPATCPKCGSDRVRHVFDEPPDRDECWYQRRDEEPANEPAIEPEEET